MVRDDEKCIPAVVLSPSDVCVSVCVCLDWEVCVFVRIDDVKMFLRESVLTLVVSIVFTDMLIHVLP